MYTCSNELDVLNLHFRTTDRQILHGTFNFVSYTFAQQYLYAYICDNIFVQNEKVFKHKPYE